MFGLIVVGMGVLWVALTLSNLQTSYAQGADLFSEAVFTQFVNGLVDGAALLGIGVMIFGVGKFFGSLQRE